MSSPLTRAQLDAMREELGCGVALAFRPSSFCNAAGPLCWRCATVWDLLDEIDRLKGMQTDTRLDLRPDPVPPGEVGGCGGAPV
jgi:hypothetical protein